MSDEEVSINRGDQARWRWASAAAKVASGSADVVIVDVVVDDVCYRWDVPSLDVDALKHSMCICCWS